MSRCLALAAGLLLAACVPRQEPPITIWPANLPPPLVVVDGKGNVVDFILPVERSQ